MDTITHAIIGATVARATAPDPSAPDSLSTKQRIACGALAAAFPDIDYLTMLIDPLAFIAEWHRSITHSLVMLPLWAILLGFGLAWLLGAQRQRTGIMLICSLSLFSHILTDLITSWGTQIFAPVTDYAPAWNLVFIIDPYFTGIITLALLVALLKRSRLIARSGIVLLALYIGMQGVLKHQAHDIGRGYAMQQDWQKVEVHTLPQPLAPFHWMIVIIDDTQYHMALVSLLRTNTNHAADAPAIPPLHLFHHYRPRRQLNWKSFPRIDTQPQATSAWSQPAFALYRKFAALPYIYRMDETRDETCTWFADLRFYLPELAPPFRYGLCKYHRDGSWQLYQLTGSHSNGVSHQRISFD